MAGDHDVSYLLVNLPLTDPTAPYHSISYLVAAATAAGYTTFSCHDANVAALSYLAQEDQVAELLETCAGVRSRLERKRNLTRWEELLYRYALKGVGMEPDSVLRALAIFKDPVRFYDYESYRSAVLVVKRWLAALSVQGFPGHFREDFSFVRNGIGSLGSVADLTDESYIAKLIGPFLPYFAGPFRRLLEGRGWDVVGLSVNYVSQLPFAVFASRLIRSASPASKLCLGGTEISDVRKYLRDPQAIWALFPDADALVVGEGESAFVEILDAVASRTELDGHRPGILVPNEAGSAIQRATPKPARYENVAALPPPRYDIWDWDEYWAPEPIVLYSPTRGCYWNKCTFCDYGLNTDSPTSPSRERPIELAIRDLQEIARIGKTLYVSVDAISPRYLRAWANGITEAGLDIRWSAELRLERSFLRGLAERLRDAGCVAISVGYESGTQRVLDLIDKGVRIADVPDILRELVRVGIGVQMMGFIGFPTETEDEACETFEFLLRHWPYWTLAGVGDFSLTQGSIVAKQSQRFGITRTQPYPGEEIARALLWTDERGRVHGSENTRAPVIDGLARKVRGRFVDDRPYVGGIDSTHSILYFGRYGPSLVPSELEYGDGQKSPHIVETAHYETTLPGVETFTDIGDLKEYRRGRAVSASSMLEWLSEAPSDQVCQHVIQTEILEIYPSGAFVSMGDRRETEAMVAGDSYKRLKHLLLAGRGAV